MNFLSGLFLIILNILHFFAGLLVIIGIITLFTKSKGEMIGAFIVLFIGISLVAYPIDKLYNMTTKSTINKINIEATSLFNNGNSEKAKTLLSKALDKHKKFDNIDVLANILKGIEDIEKADKLFLEEKYIEAKDLYLQCLNYNLSTEKINTKIKEVNTLIAAATTEVKVEQEKAEEEIIQDPIIEEELEVVDKNFQQLDEDIKTVNNPDFTKVTVPAKILGSTKEQVLSLFPGYLRGHRYEKIVDPNAIKLENNKVLIVIDFDNNGLAEGVSFHSGNSDEMDTMTGENSYVHKNHDYLINLVTGGEKVPIEYSNELFPVSIYIGNLHS